MPRKKRRTKSPRYDERHKSSRELEINQEDVAINDFANAKDAKEALRKFSRRLSDKKVAGKNRSVNNDVIPWYERTDFEPMLSDDNNESEALITTSPEDKGFQSKRNSKKKQQLVKAESDDIDEGGITYPLDVWCLLSNYVLPEDVQTFCCICKGASEAMNMRSFWLQLYNRHVTRHRRLPFCLKPERVDCRPGLRARVIRALFYDYEPFTSHITPNWSDDISSLESQMCISMWYRDVFCKSLAKYWMFYFKFSRRPGFMKRITLRSLSNMWINEENDTLYNKEAHHTVLQVKCNNFVLIPPVQGLVLTHALLLLSVDVKYNKIQLTFHTPRTDCRYRKENATCVVVLHPALDVKVLHWWDPIYPYQE